MSNLAQSKSVLTGGAFQDSGGNRVSSGYLVWTLSHDEAVQTLGAPTGVQVASGISVTTPLDNLGNVLSGFSLWANDLLSPANSFYLVRLYDQFGLPVWASPQVFVLQYAPTIDVGSLTVLVP